MSMTNFAALRFEAQASRFVMREMMMGMMSMMQRQPRR